VRDLGAPGDLVVALSTEPPPLPLPRLVAAGAVSATAGHGAFLGRTADGAAEVRRAVREIAGTGATWVKVFASGGVVTRGSRTDVQQWFDDELREAVRTARSVGLRVAAHAHSRAGLLAAIAAGVDSVEHCSETDAEVLAALEGSGTVAVSTLVATERFVGSAAIDASHPEVVAKIRAHAPKERAAVELLVSAGVEVVGATDAGTTHNPHGTGLAEQASLLVRAGARPTDALRAVTVRPATLLDVPAGVLAAGRLADVVVLDADPGERPDALASPVRVLKGGVLVNA
jgi:imidazolonepropionase-like amidohydrolase